MAYDATLVRFNRLSHSAVIGWTLKVGESRIGQTADVRTPIELSALSMTDGYEIGEGGELSLDPATATASFAEKIRTAGDVNSYALAPLNEDDRVEIVYGVTTVFQGTVVKVNVSIEASTTVEYAYLRRYTFTLTGVAGTMLRNYAEYHSLPAEDALTRLRRYFTVYTDRLDLGQLDAIQAVMMEAVDPPSGDGPPESMTYLDIAREFSAATGVPVRPISVFPTKWNHIELLPEPIAWDGITPAPAVVDTDDWAHRVDYESDGPNGLVPRALSVVTNDTRFLGGFGTTPVPGTPLGKFVIGASRIGADFNAPFGFQPPAVVDVFGRAMAVNRIQQAFTPQFYTAALELALPVEIDT